MKTLVAMLLCMLVGTTSMYAHQTKKLRKEDLPVAVRTAFEKTYPNASIKGVGQEKEDGKLLYEIESVDGSTNRDILYTLEGKAWEVEESIALDSLPGVVRKAIQKESPGGKVMKAEKVTRGKVLEYELHVEKNKHITELVIDAKGNVVKTEQVKEKKEKEESEEDEEDDND